MLTTYETPSLRASGARDDSDLLEEAAIADVAAGAVPRNNVIVGSVNANRRHWYKAGEALARANPEWLGRLVTRREKPEDFTRALERQPDDIKVLIQFSDL